MARENSDVISYEALTKQVEELQERVDELEDEGGGASEEVLGDISSALDELHTYATSLISGGASE